jgi:transposase-like protein
MIRLFTVLCKTLLENFTDEDIFIVTSGNFNHHGEKCLCCGASGNLSLNSSYVRGFVTYECGKAKDSVIRITRYQCKNCSTTHALLPDIIIPHSQYSLRFKLKALIACFERETTVTAVCLSFDIAISTIYEWKKLVLSHKELLLGVLASSKTPSLAFIRSLIESDNLSVELQDFFKRLKFSFLQRSHPATQNCSP